MTTYYILTRHGFTKINGATSEQSAIEIYCKVYNASRSAIWQVHHESKEIQYHRNPTRSEINFGHGAIHYRDFKLSDCLTKDGKIKKWFKSKDDGLRYYY